MEIVGIGGCGINTGGWYELQGIIPNLESPPIILSNILFFTICLSKKNLHFIDEYLFVTSVRSDFFLMRKTAFALNVKAKLLTFAAETQLTQTNSYLISARHVTWLACFVIYLSFSSIASLISTYVKYSPATF